MFFAVVLLGVGVAIEQLELTAIALVVLALLAAITPAHRCRTCGERWWATRPPETAPEPPAPGANDTIEPRCPRCGSMELYPCFWRRLRASSLLFTLAIFIVLPIWLVLPKWRCDQCGLWAWRRATP